MAFNLPPPPVETDPSSPAFRDWFFRLKDFLAQPIDLSSVVNILGISNGGTGTSTIPTDGQILIGNGTGYTVATLTAGDNITISNASGEITITSSGGGGVDNAEGGRADTVYLAIQNIDGGIASSILGQGLDGGSA